MKKENDPSKGKQETVKQAVALTYDRDNKDAAPVVAASGEDYLAERIIEEAEKHGITIHRDEDLVSLLAATEIGEEIPVEAFVAVAEILRYVYQKNGERAGTAQPQ